MKYGRPIWWKWFLSCEPGPWWQAREYPRCVFITQEWSRWSTIRAESPPSQNKPWLLPSSQLVTGRIHHSNTATKSHTSRISTPISPPQFLFLVLAQWQANMNGQKKKQRIHNASQDHDGRPESIQNAYPPLKNSHQEPFEPNLHHPRTNPGGCHRRNL